jgi:hypothetical protein
LPALAAAAQRGVSRTECSCCWYLIDGSSERLLGDFGTARTYRLAISRVLEAGVPARQAELLRAHLWAPRHSASSAELAEAVGYSSWRIANFQYGALAHRIALELDVLGPPRGFWVNVLIRWGADSTRSPLGHARYRLRPEVARALTDLGLADAPPRSFSVRAATPVV